MDARYNTPDRHGETRRQYNAKFGVDSPGAVRPTGADHLLAWLKDAGRSRRWDQGLPQILSLTEWKAWAELSGVLVRPEEMAVLRDMDEAYINAVVREISEQRQREQHSGSS